METCQSEVSVLVCSYNRRNMLERAITSVLNQDVVPLEIIVVDDGSDQAITLPPTDSQKIRIVKIAHQGVGAARAAGLNEARGSFIAYCDDDDEWEPHHLRTLRDYLVKHPDVALVYGDARLSNAGTLGPVAYSIDYDRELLAQGNYIFASNVMHRVEAARSVGGFDISLEAHEDWDLWLRMSHRYLFHHIALVVSTLHSHEGCVSYSQNLEKWERVYQAHQSKVILEQDVPYVKEKFYPGTWFQNRRELIWKSILREYEGYGTTGRQLLLAVERQGVDISFPPTTNQQVEGFERFYKSFTGWNKIGFYHHYDLRPSTLQCERIVNLSAWETTIVPKSHVNEINKAVTLQYVPCRQNLEAFIECGVKVPLRILHHGIEPSQFPYLERPYKEMFTFGTFGDLTPRKGIDVLLRAFMDEFRKNEPVRLIMKSMSADYSCEDSRVILRTGFLDDNALQEFLRQMDVFVLPSRGEGFGKCGLEAMATGLSIIATNWSGPAEYLDPEDSFPLSYKLIEARQTKISLKRKVVYGDHEGQWAEPDYEHLRHLMRWVYEHPKEVLHKGKLASKRVHANWTWDRVARQMCDEFAILATE